VGGGEETVGASHAWAEALMPGRGWIGYDATHPVRAGETYVTGSPSAATTATPPRATEVRVEARPVLDRLMIGALHEASNGSLASIPGSA
jgi:transglutaminase-like putative cysteine protease